MSNYGFDYFTKRTNILNEMARPWTGMKSIVIDGKPVGETADRLFNQAGLKIKQGGTLNVDGESVNVPGYTGPILTNRKLRYFIYMLTGMYKYDGSDEDFTSDDFDNSTEEFSEGRATEEIVKQAMSLLGHPGEKPNDIGYERGQYDRLYRDALMAGVKKYPDVVMSPEFQKDMLDENNILYYMKYRRVPYHSNYGIKKAEGLENRYNLPIEEVHRIIQTAKPLLNKIHRARHHDRMRTNPKYSGESLTGSGENIDNNYTDNLDRLLASLESWIQVKGIFEKVIDSLNLTQPKDIIDSASVLQQYLGGIDRNQILSLMSIRSGTRDDSLLEDLYDTFSELTDVGISMEDINQEFESLKGVVGANTYPIFDLILNDLGQNTKEQPTDKYPGYSNKILSDIIKTDEDMRIFDEWARKIYLPDYEAKVASIRQQIQDQRDQLGVIPDEKIERQATPPEEDPRMKKIADLENRMASGDYTDDDPYSDDYDPFKESYVMGYMTEQVSRDRFKPKGEFKDRGFKKPINYAHWMDINK